MSHHHALHPDPNKNGVNINTDKYRAIRRAIESIVGERQPIGFSDLVEAVDALIGASFDGSIPWYVTTVKLDMEARGILKRVPGRGPQRLQLTAQVPAPDQV